MPATEKTWRDQLRMHVIFGVTSLVMLFATIVMLWKDHNREWRQWQLADRERERWTIESQLAQTQADTCAKHEAITEKLNEARRQKVDGALVDEFKQTVRNEDHRLDEVAQMRRRLTFPMSTARWSGWSNLKPGQTLPGRAAQICSAPLNDFVREAKRRELELTTRRKFMAADLTSAVSLRGIAVGEGRPAGEIKQREDKIQRLSREIADQDVKVVAAKDYRKELESLVGRVQADENSLQKQIAAIDTDIKRLEEQAAKNPVSLLENPLEKVVRWPIIDAFNTGNIKLDQIWLPDMKINYNFSSVARYDRCINCHRAIDKTAPGSAVEPAYPDVPRDQRIRTVQMDTPATAPDAADGATGAPSIESVYGLRLADRGQVIYNDVTVQVVRPDSLAAKAGLMMGDVIKKIDGGDVQTPADAHHYLLELVTWGKPLAVEIQRGLSQPFTSHPRLDLFVGSTSPHKRGEMGCTICHDGQGSRDRV